MSVLTIIVFLLLVSAVIRLGSDAGSAWANASQILDEKEKLTNETETIDHTLNKPPDRPKLASLLATMQEREKRILERERMIEVRAKALAVANVEVERRLSLLEETEVNLRKTIAVAASAAEDDLARLTTVYENMKPKDAAKVFGAMEPDFAAGFLGRMRPDVAAAVLAGLPAEAAYSISVVLAGRNAGAPKN